MPDERSAFALIRAVGLMADGPVPWGRSVRHPGPGVVVVELPAPQSAAPLELTLVGKWLERVPDLRLDDRRPTSKELLRRLEAFWLPSAQVLFVGSTTGSIGGRLAAMAKTVPGDRKPAWTGFWLHFLRNPAALRVWWAATDDPELFEDALIDAFAAGVPAAERAALPGGAMAMPWAVLRSPSGSRKPTGIANPLLPEVKASAPVPVSRIIELPPAEADGARDETRRGRRPAPGHGVGRLASAAAYAAQGSPRVVHEPVLVSPGGLARLRAELDALKAQRPALRGARRELSDLDGRIRALGQRLGEAVVVAPTERGQAVEHGARVRVAGDRGEADFRIVSSVEAEVRGDRLSSASPVGAALLGRRVGDVVTILAPGSQLRYTILEVD